MAENTEKTEKTEKTIDNFGIDTSSDMYNFMFPNERPEANAILQRMGEYYNCILTKEEENLITVPVDFNPSNILPSNMARISKRFMEKSPIVLEYLLSFKSLDDVVFTVTFKSIAPLYNYNKQLLSFLPVDFILEKPQAAFLNSENFDERFNGTNLVSAFEFLTRSHIKGIDKITIQDHFSLDWIGFQSYVVGVLERNKSKSNIIRPNFGWK